MLDKLLNLSSIHEVRKTLKANDIGGAQASKLESEWLAAKELETEVNTEVVSQTEVTTAAEVTALEEVIPAEEHITPVTKAFRAAKFSK